MEEGPGPGREGQGAGRGGGRLHLGCVAVEVGEKANPHGVRTAAGSFQDPQVPDDLGEALPETDAPEVNCQGPGIKESCKVRCDEGMPSGNTTRSLGSDGLSSGPAFPTHCLCDPGPLTSLSPRLSTCKVGNIPNGGLGCEHQMSSLNYEAL